MKKSFEVRFFGGVGLYSSCTGCYLSPLRLSSYNWNARTNETREAEAISCTPSRWPTCLRGPADSDNNSTDAPLQVVHNNEGARCIRCSQLLRCNQMLRSKTACHAAIWHGEIRLDQIHFGRLAIPARHLQCTKGGGGGVLRHEHWHIYRAVLTPVIFMLQLGVA